MSAWREAAGAGEAQSRPRRRPLDSRTASTRSSRCWSGSRSPTVAVRPRIGDACVRASRTTRSCAPRSTRSRLGPRRAALRGAHREADPGRGGPRRRVERRRHRARAGERACSSPASTRRPSTSSRRALGADVPFFLRDGAQLGDGGRNRARAGRPSRATTRSVLALPEGVVEVLDRGRLRGLRRTRRRARLRGARRALPPRSRLGAARPTSRGSRRTTSRPRRSPRSSVTRRIPRRRDRCGPGRLRPLREPDDAGRAAARSGRARAHLDRAPG